MKAAWTLLASLVLAGAASAQTLPTCATTRNNPMDGELTWQRPASFTDGTAIPANAVVTYVAYRAPGASGGTFTAQCQTTALAATVWNTVYGTHRYHVTAAVDGETSAPSSTVTKTTAAPKRVPRPPAGVAAQ